MNPFEKSLKKLDIADIEDAQDRDFDSWLYRLMEFPQGLFDMLYVESDPEWNDLTDEQIKDRKATLDAAFVHLQIAMEEISMVLKKKYPQDMEKPHNRINF